jgi:hypothetical protein
MSGLIGATIWPRPCRSCSGDLRTLQPNNHECAILFASFPLNPVLRSIDVVCERSHSRGGGGRSPNRVHHRARAPVQNPIPESAIPGLSAGRRHQLGVGDDIQQAKVKGKPTEIWQGIQKFKKGPCIVVAPQCLKNSKSGERGIWTPEDLNLLLQHLKATLPVDDRRIYLTGISMGGYGTWAWGAHDPQHFAAIESGPDSRLCLRRRVGQNRSAGTLGAHDRRHSKSGWQGSETKGLPGRRPQCRARRGCRAGIL